MRIPVLLVTYNRLEYSKKALESICEDPGVAIELNIWDNGSTETGMQEWLTFIEGQQHRNAVLAEVVRNTENHGLARTMNWFFRKYSTQPYVVKVDNDTVLPKDWLKDLLEGMEMARRWSGNALRLKPGLAPPKIGAVSATCLRPNGDTFAEWVRKYMITDDCGNGEFLHYNSYILGTGVLINMDMIRERGLMFEKFPYGPEPGEQRTCLISGWGAYQRIAADYDGWKFAFYSKVHANLLNLREEHVLSNDYPEYDEELKDARDQGNAWWESVGGLPGVKKYVDEHGGLERLPLRPGLVPLGKSPDVLHATEYAKWPEDKTVQKRYLTECDEHDLRTTQAWWEERVKREGVSRAIFLDQTQARTNEFTAIHEAIIRQEIKPHMDVCEVGVGWGRMAPIISQCAKSYVGTDFVEQLLETARETLPKLEFMHADAGKLPFADGSFDAVVAVTCVSSFDERFDAIMKEMLRVTRKSGFVLLLEEEWSRKQWKLENK